jgi:hypothetical protein
MNSSSDIQNELKKNSLHPDLQLNYLETEEVQSSSPIGLNTQISIDGFSQPSINTARPQTVINALGIVSGINQYIHNVPMAGKPPQNS